MLLEISINGKLRKLELNRTEDLWSCRIDGREFLVDAEAIDQGTLSLLIQGKSFEVRRVAENTFFVAGRNYEVSIEDPRSWRGRKRSGAGTEGPQKVIATMPGKIVRVLAKEGEKITAGQGIAVIEAMKMQNEVKSPKEGTLKKMLAHAGMNVNAGEVLAIVD